MVNVNVNMDGSDLAHNVFRLVLSDNISMERTVFVNKDMLELMEFVDHAHQEQFQTPLKQHVFVRILSNSSLNQLYLVLIAQHSHLPIKTILIVSVSQDITSKVPNASHHAQLTLLQTKMVFVCAQEAKFYQEMFALPQLFAQIDQLSTQLQNHVSVTAEMKTSLMDNVKLVDKTAYGAKINVFAQLDSSKLLEFVEHVILELNMMVKIVSVILDILEIEIFVHHATNHAANVQDLKPINVHHAPMSHLSLKKVIVLKTLLATMDSSKMVPHVLNVLITVSAVLASSNVLHAQLVSKRIHKLSLVKKLSAAMKFAVMVSSMNNNAMMEIIGMETVAAANVNKKKDGSAVEALQAIPAFVKNSFPIKFNSPQEVLLTWEVMS